MISNLILPDGYSYSDYNSAYRKNPDGLILTWRTLRGGSGGQPISARVERIMKPGSRRERMNGSAGRKLLPVAFLLNIHKKQ